MTEKARILFVDDEKRVLNSMRGMFRREYELFLTCEGAEAVRIAAENDVDVIVADQRMPGMTGVEVLAKVKEKSPRTVRVLLTGYADPSAVEGSINVGEVFRFLSKPCPPKMLRETLSLAISASRTAPAAAAANEPLPAKTPPPEPASIKPIAAEPAAAEPVAPEPASVEPPMAETIRDNDETHPSMRALSESDVQIQSRNDTSSSHWQTVTSVIMSEDTVEETQETVGLTTPTLDTSEVGVVIFTVDSEFATTAFRAASADRNAILATTLVKVAQAIEHQNAGVLVTDYTTNNSIIKKIVAALKQRMPHLVTIVVSDGRDTTDMISLINYGQVFRYVLKPIEPEQLRRDINAAVVRHLYLLHNPESAKRHQVIDKPVETAGSSATVNRFLGRIQQMPVAKKDPTDTNT